MTGVRSFLDKNVLYLAWAQAFVAVFGSLYYSEIAGFLPCILCWYQRILMYPILVILTVGILRKDKTNLPFYVLPLSFAGIGVSLYQTLLQIGLIPEEAAPCVLGVSCATKYINYLGFITIPLLSLTAFVIISLCLLYYRRLNHEK